MAQHCFKYIMCVVGFVVSFISCVSTNNNVTLSSDPTVSSFSLKNDSFPNLKTTTFIVDERVDTGLIYNADSIKFGTPIDSVLPLIYYKASAVAAAVIYTPNDTFSLSSNDTIDFSERPVLLHVVSQDLKYDKWYEVQVNVHQVDPDLYIWEQVATDLFSPDYSVQKAVMLKDSICLFISNGFEIKLLTSVDGSSWSAVRAVSSLPANAQIKAILSDGRRLYVGCRNAIYTSEDAQNWQIAVQDDNWVVASMLFVFNNKVWAVVRSDDSDKYEFISTADCVSWETYSENILVAEFPYSDYTAATFYSPSGRQRGIVAGGFNIDGAEIHSLWNVEYDEARGYNWKQFEGENNYLYGTGITILPYDRHLLLFGMEDGSAPYAVHMLESYTEGYSWTEADTAHNKMPEGYVPRVAQAMVIDSANHIYMIGGRSKSTVFTDVYKGKLNSVDW